MVESDDLKKCNIIIAHGIVCCATSTNSQGERMRRRIARACVHWRPAQQPQDKNRIKCYKNQSLHCYTTHWLKPGERSSLENIQIENYGEEEPLQSNWCSEY